MSRKTIIILACVLIPVAILVLLASTGWGGAGWFEQFPNANFVIAFAIGATLTVLLAVGLMALVFISSRRGFDDGTENEMKDPSHGLGESPKDSDGP